MKTKLEERLIARVSSWAVCPQNRGPCPMQEVVVRAVRKAVRAATMIFTVTSMNRWFFMAL